MATSTVFKLLGLAAAAALQLTAPTLVSRVSSQPQPQRSLVSMSASVDGLQAVLQLPVTLQVATALVIACPLVKALRTEEPATEEPIEGKPREGAASRAGKPTMRAGPPGGGSRNSKYKTNTERYRSAPQREIEEKFGEKPVRVFTWGVTLGLYALMAYGVYAKATAGL